MRNNDSVICLSYRLWNTTKHLSVNIKSCHAVIDIRFNPSRANSSDNYNFVSFPLKITQWSARCVTKCVLFPTHTSTPCYLSARGDLFPIFSPPEKWREATTGNTSAFAGYLATGGAKFGV